jgi:PhzF family phenazine biosynthesis protein
MQLVRWGLNMLMKNMTREINNSKGQTKKVIHNFKNKKANRVKTYFLDSFTTEKFKGNPAAVCLVETEIAETTMQNIAAEIGFSETAFIQKKGDAVYGIRFFTPKKEIALCGHATLAAAKVIFGLSAISSLVFTNKDGIQLKIENSEGKIRMEFPCYTLSETKIPDALLHALGIQTAVYAGYNKEINCLMIEIADSKQLQSLKPDTPKLLASYKNIAGVLVTAKNNSDSIDYEYRYFWPWIGSDEDPVTGAVQTFLTPYWAKKLNKKDMKAFQASQRTGYMETQLSGNTVYIYGDAVQILEGTLNL